MRVMVLDSGNSIIKALYGRRQNNEVAIPNIGSSEIDVYRNW